MSKRQVLYRKWRPKTFADFVGQEHIKQTIVNSIKSDKIGHAYLFAGPRGTGKTSMARLLAKAVNCLEPKDNGEPCNTCANCTASLKNNMVDLIEIDAASHTGVDDVRSLIEKVNLAPSLGKYKVYIIDEVHMLSKNAFNALLKTLEEPPAHVLFILATTEVHKLLPTVISRCQYFDFHHLTWQEITDQIKKITKQEKVVITDEAVSLIAQNSEGSMRDALSILDQVISLENEKIDKQTLEKILGITDNKVVFNLTEAILNSDINQGIAIINEVYFKGYDMDQLVKNWINYLRRLLMTRLGNQDLINQPEDEKEILLNQSEKLTYAEIINLIQKIIESNNKYKIPSLPQLALELVVIKCINQKSELKETKKVDSRQILESSTSQRTPQNDEVGEIPRLAPLARDDKESSTQNDEVESLDSRDDKGDKVAEGIKSQIAEKNLDNKPIEEKIVPKVSKKIDKIELPDDIWSNLCKQVSENNPALSALMKNAVVISKSNKLTIQAPNKFSYDMISKKSNLNLISGYLQQLGHKDIDIECELSDTAKKTVDQVAEVFDII